MAMNVGKKEGGVQSEINVTPLIDVLLVLLIIFLVVMPLLIKMESVQVPHELPEGEVDRRLQHYGVPTDLPIIVQVSRFDRWKDPEGVIRAFQIARRKHDCTLVLVGNSETRLIPGREPRIYTPRGYQGKAATAEGTESAS